MINVPSTSAERISQLILMLSSSHDGEIANAARAIDRVLKAEHCDWHDLTNALLPVPARAPENNSEHWSEWHWRSTAEWCSQFEDVMTEWEIGFVHSVMRWRRTPTPKQIDCLRDIRQHILKRKRQEVKS